MLSPYQFNPANYHPLRAIVEEMLDDRRRSAPPSGPEALRQRHQRPRRQAAGLPGRGDHRRRHPRLGLPADALPGDRDRRPQDRPPRGLLGRRLHRQPGALSAVLPHPDAPTSSSSTSTRSTATSCRRTASEIVSRINEISFNASLLRELRNIDFVNRLLDRGVIAEGTMKRNHVHSVSDDTLMNQLGMVTKMTISRDAAAAAQRRRPRGDGRASSPSTASDLGKRSSVDLRAMVQLRGSRSDPAVIRRLSAAATRRRPAP